ncbi:DnaJ domain-containing protein [Nostoc sp. LEGE 12450]|nr:DnaJ domain-containing protein [Nostoc sp. LEGE 12450]
MLSGEWWEILGVDQSDNANFVKLAYRRLARQYHSDVNSSASQKL